MVQGHVKQEHALKLKKQTVAGGITLFEYDETLNNLTIEKGSITVNGVSLTVVNQRKNQFSVAIIPYTHEHTISIALLWVQK
jgi:riboflavin synthase